VQIKRQPYNLRLKVSYLLVDRRWVEEIDGKRIVERHCTLIRIFSLFLKVQVRNRRPGTSGDSQEAEFERSLLNVHFNIRFMLNK